MGRTVTRRQSQNPPDDLARPDDSAGPTGPLFAYLEGSAVPVGILDDLTHLGGASRLRFTYSADYCGPDLSSAMPRRAEPYANADTRVFFDNLLPEGPGRRLIGPGDRPIDEDDVFGLLRILGAECPGAVMVLPVGAPLNKVPGDLSADYMPLADAEVAARLRALSRGVLPGETERASLPGVHGKLALAFDAATGSFLSPLHKAFPTTHILKVAPKSDPRFVGIVAIEALCMRCVSILGFPAAEVDRFSNGGTEALVVRRYDRLVSGSLVTRLHQEDAAQALGLDRALKYEDKARAAGRDAGYGALFGPFCALTAAPAATRDLLRGLSFLNWMLGNNDAHLKNFSLLHPPGGDKPSLAPFYDIVSVEALPGGWKGMAMAMNGKKVTSAVRGADIEWLASQEGSARVPAAGVRRRRLAGFRTLASDIHGAIDRVVGEGTVSDQEAAPVRDVVDTRLARLNRDLGWGLPLANRPGDDSQPSPIHVGPV